MQPRKLSTIYEIDNERKMSPTGSSPHVLILGAGLGGLAFAQALRKRGMSYEIFERDAGWDERPQGWTVSVHRLEKQDSNYPKLPDANKPPKNSMIEDMKDSVCDDMTRFTTVDHLDALQIPCEFAYFKHDSNAKMGLRDDGSQSYIWANRATLRKWLATNIHIQYDKRAVRIEEGDKTVTVYFKDGSSATGDLLVGAEGVSSMSTSAPLPSDTNTY